MQVIIHLLHFIGSTMHIREILRMKRSTRLIHIKMSNQHKIEFHATGVQVGQKDWVLACSGHNFAVWEALL